MKKRIWELDAFRGLCIIGVVLVHLVYDLVDLYEIIQWECPDWFAFVRDWGGILFLLLSGICVTLGSRSVRRGIIVLCGGMLCTAATWLMWKNGFDRSIIIYFGILHCLGVCMLLWPMYKPMRWWALLFHGLVFTAAGFLIAEITAPHAWMVALGFDLPTFASSDYFPLLPNLGFFLIGAAIGRLIYSKKISLLPCINEKTWFVRPLCFCGRHSLWIYLIHQPVLAGICYLLTI